MSEINDLGPELELEPNSLIIPDQHPWMMVNIQVNNDNQIIMT